MQIRVSRPEIAVGAFLIAAVLGFLTLVVGSGGWESLGRKTFTVRATFKQVSGVRNGAIVRMNGIEVGVVKDVFINDKGRVELAMEIEASYRKYLAQTPAARDLAASGMEPTKEQIADFERDGCSVVRVESPLLGGDSVVTVSPAGSAALAPISEGERLVGEPETRGIQEAVKKVDAVLANLLGDEKGGESLGTIVQQIGKALADLQVVLARVEKASAGVEDSTVGHLMNDRGAFLDDARGTLKKADETLASVQKSLDAAVESVKSSAGNLDDKVTSLAKSLEDTTAALNHTLDEVNSILARIREEGLLAAVDSKDQALRRRIDDVLKNLNDVVLDLKKTTEKLPALAGQGTDLLAGGKNAVKNVDVVARGTRRHWLLKGLFEPPRDEWLRAWDLGPAPAEKAK